MRDAMSQMAADVFAEMTRDTPGNVPHAQPEGEPPYPHVEVERELLGDPPMTHVQMPELRTLHVPATSWAAEQWAREHPQALLVGTVAAGWLARQVRRGRRGHRPSG